MTKIYLVYAKRKGVNRNVVKEVFTNFRLASKYADYFNLGQKEVYYWVVTKVICRTHYGDIPF